MKKRFLTIEEKIQYYQNDLFKCCIIKSELKNPSFFYLLFETYKKRRQRVLLIKRYDRCIAFLKEELIETKVAKHEFYSTLLTMSPISQN